MRHDMLRWPALTIGSGLSLMLLGLAACTPKSTETAADFTPNPAGMYGTVAPAARQENAQPAAKDGKAENTTKEGNTAPTDAKASEKPGGGNR